MTPLMVTKNFDLGVDDSNIMVIYPMFVRVS